MIQRGRGNTLGIEPLLVASACRVRRCAEHRCSKGATGLIDFGRSKRGIIITLESRQLNAWQSQVKGLQGEKLLSLDAVHIKHYVMLMLSGTTN